MAADVMDRTGADTDLGGGFEPPMFGLGEWLPERRFFWDRAQEPWLRGLAAFDRSEEWRADGQLSCVDWVVWKMRVCRGTAFEWLRVAHELERRPVIAEALRSGEITYSAARAITRLDRPEGEVDKALVDLAKTGPAASLEHAIRYYQACQKQDDLPKHLNRFDRRGIHFHHQFNGLDVANMVLDPVERAEVQTAIEAFMDPDPVDNSTADDSPTGPAGGGGPGPVDYSTAGDDPAGGGGPGPVDDSTAGDDPAPDDFVPFSQRRADAFMDLVRTALAHRRDGHAAGADRYMVHAIIDTATTATARAGAGGRADAGTGQLLDGTTLPESVTGRLACDASIVAHLVDGTEPLSLGRKTRVWSSAQRRAITVRDASRCRFPGCTRRIGDIHHIHHWAHGGPTDTTNGAYICTRHHTLLHQGFNAVGDANHQLTFTRPDGTTLGTTTPPNRITTLLPL